MIYILTNSTGFRCNEECHLWLTEISGIMYPWCFSIIEAWWQIQQITLKPEDIVILNVGINDCIYRKDKVTQKNLMIDLLYISKNRQDKDAELFYEEKIKYIEHKKDEEMFQLLTFQEFESYLDKIFQKIGSQGIVLSIIWYPENHPKIGWAYHESIKTNEILETKVKQYGSQYFSLWTVGENRTYDGVHLTRDGHRYVTERLIKILKIILPPHSR